MRTFWPAAEAAQADYETLRTAVMRGDVLDSLMAARFARRGVAGLVAWPASEPVFAGRVLGAARPPWTPGADPRLGVLAAGYELLVAAPVTVASLSTVGACRLATLPICGG